MGGVPGGSRPAQELARGAGAWWCPHKKKANEQRRVSEEESREGFHENCPKRSLLMSLRERLALGGARVKANSKERARGEVPG